MPQRSPRNDPTLLDGDSGHGNPGEPAGDEQAVDSDTDVGSLAGDTAVRQDEFEEGGQYPNPEVTPTRGEAGARDLPIRGYQQLTVPEVVRRAAKLPPAEVGEVLAFERSHRNRRTLVARLSRLAGRK